jgi:hypothetical protein
MQTPTTAESQAAEKLTKHALRRKMSERHGSWLWARHSRAAKSVRVSHVLAFRQLRTQFRAGDYINEVNARGNIVWRDQDVDAMLGFQSGSRHAYDERLLPAGWQQYDTSNDAWYFACFVHRDRRMTMTYVEGDRVLVECPTLQSFAAELLDMERFYGPPPPAFVHFSGTGVVTKFYDTRPSV